MKVLMIGQLPVEAGGSYTTGVCNVVYELSKCATKDAQVVVYATNMNDKKAHTQGYAKYRGSLLNPIKLVVEGLRHPVITCKEWKFYRKNCQTSSIRNIAYRNNIERLIEEEKPDMIHCMSVYQLASCYFANKKHHLPLILTLHGVSYQKHEYSGVKLADVVTGLTPETMKGIRTLGASEEKMVMVPNGTDTSKFYFSETVRKQLRKELGVDDGTTVMLTIGSLSHRKGQLSFLSIIKDISKNFNYLYLIIGKGDDGEKIADFIEKNNMQSHVRMIGYVNNADLYKYHSAADIYIHASRIEGQALSEVEAYATDLKIALNRDVIGTVITDTSNTNDYWVFDFDSFDKEAFVKWASVHKESRKTRSLYDWKRIFEMYCKIYKEMQK